MKRFGNLSVMLLVFAVFMSLDANNSRAADKVADKPDEVEPLDFGDKIPELKLLDASGSDFDLSKAVSEKPTALVFYRGGWCMYCNAQLSDYRKTEKDLVNLGFQLIATSPDNPEHLTKSKTEKELTYTLLSDSNMEAAKAFGVAFQLPADLIDTYKNKYKLDLAGYSGQSHYQLPVPAVFLVGTDGVIEYRHYDPDYKKRLSGEDLLEEAKAVLAKPAH